MRLGFWLFMLVMNLLLPVIMIGFGAHFVNHPPEKINFFYGYRSKMSMKNQDTWNYLVLH